MDKLSQILWRERERLERLAYELEIERLVLATGRSRWLARASRDVDETLTEIRWTEVLRAVAADEAAEELGMAHNPSLAGLAEAAGEPWCGILLEHRDALIDTAREIGQSLARGVDGRAGSITGNITGNITGEDADRRLRLISSVSVGDSSSAPTTLLKTLHPGLLAFLH